jgi:DNA processing protein
MAPSLTVAIVGSRQPIPAAAAFARELAGAVASRGGVVVSGGATGIDAAAHEGALAVGGRTWVVAATGRGEVFPRENADLFDRVPRHGGAMVWPFPPGTPVHRSRFLQRNAVLVALADVFVVVQARIPSGALNAASWARRMGRPRWTVCPLPWSHDPDFAGCDVERRLGARALTSITFFLEAIGMPAQPPKAAVQRTLAVGRNAAESAVLHALEGGPRHIDELVARCAVPYPEVMTALLTLALDDVLVEGPEGSYRLTGQP